jgi:serine/threonine protein kinase
MFESEKTQSTGMSLSSIEVHLGSLLGGGQFGRVYEIAAFYELQRSAPNPVDSDSSLSTPGGKSQSGKISPRSSMNVPRCSLFLNALSSSFGSVEDETETKRDPLEIQRERARIMKDALLIDGKPRYAIKVVKTDLRDRKLCLATMDLACELKFLSALDHPNIIKARAIMGSLGRPNGFGIIMDRLEGTLQDKIKEWSLQKRSNDHKKRRGTHNRRGSLLLRISKFLLHQSTLSCSQNCQVRPQTFQHDDLFLDRLFAIYDVAKAMQYLHSKHILFRDLKTPNVGLTLDGGYALFDFGLAKELKLVDLVEEPDMYKATGMTGTRAFMAPEVAMFLPYGFSADVYSFAMLMWEVMALEMAYPNMSVGWHYDSVVLGNERPRNLKHNLPKEINEMIVQSWSTDPKRRPTFSCLCDILNNYISSQVIGVDNAEEKSIESTVMTGRTNFDALPKQGQVY